jgi:four helix bundle protein
VVQVAIESYRDLDVWQVAMPLAQESYLLTARFPKDEMYGMAGQIRRAAVSIPANIAEGHGRDQTGKMLRSLIRSLETCRANNQ